MRDFLKNKKWTITIYILLIVFIFLTAFCYNLENRYKKLYFSNVFQSVDNLYTNSNQLKNQIDDIINCGRISSTQSDIKINSQQSQQIRKLAESAYYNYSSSLLDYNNFHNYSDKKINESNINIFYQIQDYCNYLERIVNASKDGKLLLNQDDINSLRIIYNICDEIHAIYNNYGSDLARKHEFIKNGKWINLLNDLQRLCDRHSNLTKEFTNYKNNG